MMVARSSLRQRIVLTLGIAVIMGAIPSTLQLFYLPALYERAEEGANVERQAFYAHETVLILSPSLQIDCVGERVTSWATHGHMRTWDYRRPWIEMYFINGLSWWCIILVIWWGVGKLRNLRRNSQAAVHESNRST